MTELFGKIISNVHFNFSNLRGVWNRTFHAITMRCATHDNKPEHR